MALTKKQLEILEQTAKYVADVSSKEELEEAVMSDLFNWVHRKLNTKQYQAIINSSNKDESIVFVQRQLPGNAYKYEYVLLNFGNILIELANEVAQLQTSLPKEEQIPFDGTSIVNKIKELLINSGKWQPVKEAYQQNLQVSEVTCLSLDERLIINAIQRAATIKDLTNIVAQLARSLKVFKIGPMTDLLTVFPGYKTQVPAQQAAQSATNNPQAAANNPAANTPSPATGATATPPPQANVSSAPAAFNPSSAPSLPGGSSNLTVTPQIKTAVLEINKLLSTPTPNAPPALPELKQNSEKLAAEVEQDKISDARLFIDFYRRALEHYSTNAENFTPADRQQWTMMLDSLKVPYENFKATNPELFVKAGSANMGKAANPFKGLRLKNKGTISSAGGAAQAPPKANAAPQYGKPQVMVQDVDYSKLALDAINEVKKQENSDFFKNFTIN